MGVQTGDFPIIDAVASLAAATRRHAAGGKRLKLPRSSGRALQRARAAAAVQRRDGHIIGPGGSAAKRSLFPVGLWDRLAYAVLFSYLVLVLWTFPDYGIGWDEQFQLVYGEHILRWYATGFRDDSALTFLNLKYYGGFFEVLAQGASRMIPGGIYEVRHFMNGLFGIVGALGAYRLGRYLAGAPAGFLAALFLVLTPVYYGHSYHNPKDIPFAVLYLWSVYYLVRAIRHFPAPPWPLVAKLGITIGLALGVRVGGVLLIVFGMAAFGLWCIDTYLLRRHGLSDLPSLRSAVVSFAPRWLAVCTISYLLMLVWWPWAQVDPLRHPLAAMREASRFPWGGTVLFEERMVPASELPWYYVSKWALITLPEFLLLGLAAGCFFAAISLLRRRGSAGDSQPLVEYATVLLCMAAPMGYAAITGAVLYDGLRHFLFVVPLASVLAAVALAKLVAISPPPVATAVSGLTLASLILTGADMVQLHPYQYIYFNRIFGGGLQGAAGAYETEYWGTSYKEGAEWLTRTYPVPRNGRKLRVASCSWPASTSYYLREDRFEYVGSIEYGITAHPDLFLATTRFGCHLRVPGRIVHAVQRQETPILYIKQLTQTRY